MNKKILVIDDENTYREIIADALRGAGYDALEAESGDRGIQIARSHKPDLILCDLIMPGLSGYETLVALKKDPVTAAIPVVFLSGISDTASKERAMELGVTDYVEKPFALADLLALVERKLKKKG